MDILTKALEITNCDRNLAYGEPEQNFQQIADYWNVFIKHKMESTMSRSTIFKIKTPDIGIMMCLLKIAREEYGHNKDNLIDMAGYARCVSRVYGDENNEGG